MKIAALFFILAALCGCAANGVDQPAVHPPASASDPLPGMPEARNDVLLNDDIPAANPFENEESAAVHVVSACWQPLVQALVKDGFEEEYIRLQFSQLGAARSTKPMETKIGELFRNSFAPKKKTAAKKQGRQIEYDKDSGIPLPWFKDIVVPENIAKCRSFIETNQDAFRSAYARFGVPPETAAALLFVETRLGTYLGKHSAFSNLAGMASTRHPDDIRSFINSLEMPSGMDNTSRDKWIRSKMLAKSDWAYAELKALLAYCRNNDIEPMSLPGSIYGAIGLCQFMPSNLPVFGCDGDGDGIINVFEPSDAVASLSRYLSRNGWNRSDTVESKLKVLRTYNNMQVYANTVLALAWHIEHD